VRQGHLCVWDICAFGTFVLNTRFSPFLRSLYVIQLYVANGKFISYDVRRADRAWHQECLVSTSRAQFHIDFKPAHH
jgi:hypothetical protein